LNNRTFRRKSWEALFLAKLLGSKRRIPLKNPGNASLRDLYVNLSDRTELFLREGVTTTFFELPTHAMERILTPVLSILFFVM
jgi:hypothetical protein